MPNALFRRWQLTSEKQHLRFQRVVSVRHFEVPFAQSLSIWTRSILLTEDGPLKRSPDIRQGRFDVYLIWHSRMPVLCDEIQETY